jgi:hypothetical protein
MDRQWTPELRVHETGAGCRLTLVGVTYGNGETLQDAADDLVTRLLNLTLGVRSSGFRLPSDAGRPDPRVLELLWDLGEMAAHGQDIRERIFGRAEAPDSTS